MARRCHVVDSEGNRCEVTLALLLRWTVELARETLLRKPLLARIEREVEALAGAATRRIPAATNGPRPVLYLRTDLSFIVRAGGSVGHMSGVLNELAHQAGQPILLTTAAVPTLGKETEVHVVAVPEAFWNFRELPTFLLNDVFYDSALQVLDGRRI